MSNAHTFETVTHRVTAIVAEQLGMERSAVKPESTLHALQMDSLDYIEAVMCIEDEFGILIPDPDLEGIKTIGALVEYVALRTAGVA